MNQERHNNELQWTHFERVMRNKLIPGLLATALAVVLFGYAYLSVSGRRFLTGSEFARFSITVGRSLGHPKEGGPSRVVSLLKAALSFPPASGSIEIDSQAYSFPLPKYAVPQDQNADRYYFVAFVTPGEMDNYFNRELPQAGWKQVDQMGAAHFMEGHNVHMTIVQHFYLTSDISDFNVSITDHP